MFCRTQVEQVHVMKPRAAIMAAEHKDAVVNTRGCVGLSRLWAPASNVGLPPLHSVCRWEGRPTSLSLVSGEGYEDGLLRQGGEEGCTCVKDIDVVEAAVAVATSKEEH